MTLLLPLFLLTVRRSSDLAMAMEETGGIQEAERPQECIHWYIKEDRAGYLF